MNILWILGGIAAYTALVVFVLRFFARGRDWGDLGDKLREEKFRFRRYDSKTKL